MALKNKKSNFSEWYVESLISGDFIDYSKVSGAYIYKPNSYSIWESIQKFLDKKFKSDGVKNAYFPLLIPENLLNKESKHVEGFSPEVAWVTHTGKSKLSERLAIRPTSETIMYDSYSKWIRSWKDLPLRLNQWANVVRWEFKHPTPFLRSREFLWQEGHSVFESRSEAEKEAFDIHSMYKEVYEKLLAIPVLSGIKSEKEKFAGAEKSLSLETIMPDGKAIQASTSHELGQIFSKAFNIKFLDKNEKKSVPYQNSWGISTRSIGIMLAVHGDDKGFVIPPKVAQNKIVIVPILFKGKEAPVLKKSNELTKLLKKYGTILDDRTDVSAGYKFNHWEVRGIPLRVEIGPRDLENKSVTIVRRDTGIKESVKVSKIESRISELLKIIQKEMYEKAKVNLDNSIIHVDSIKELKTVVNSGKIARAFWCGSIKSEEEIKKSTGAKSLTCNFIYENPKFKDKSCFLTGDKPKFYAYFGKSH